jgi:hypothetical protein
MAFTATMPRVPRLCEDARAGVDRVGRQEGRRSSMRLAIGRVGAATAAGALVVTILLLLPGVAVACSPPSPPPTVATLPEGAVVLVGTTGEPADGGRLFYVERVYAGDVTTSPIVIAFQEGEPVGDCSYPVAAGMHLVIAPDVDADGTLRASLPTLQADPASETGRRFVAEALARYGPGSVPAGATVPPGASGGLAIGAIAVGMVGAAVVLVLAWRRRWSRPR